MLGDAAAVHQMSSPAMMPKESVGQVRVALADALARLGPKLDTTACTADSIEPEQLVATLSSTAHAAKEPTRLQAARCRHEAARALCNLREGAAPHADALAAALGDPEHDVRLAAAEAMGHMGSISNANLDALTASLTNKNVHSHILGHVPLPGTGNMGATPHDGEWQVRSASARALHRLSPRTAPNAVHMARAMHDRSPTVRLTAGKAIQSFGPAVTGQLVAAMEDHNNQWTSPRILRSIAHALGTLGVPAAPHMEAANSSALASLLKHGHREVQHAALEALEELSCPPGFVPAVPAQHVYRARCRSATHHALLLNQCKSSFDEPQSTTAPGGGRKHGLSTSGRRPMETVHWPSTARGRER